MQQSATSLQKLIKKFRRIALNAPKSTNLKFGAVDWARTRDPSACKMVCAGCRQHSAGGTAQAFHRTENPRGVSPKAAAGGYALFERRPQNRDCDSCKSHQAAQKLQLFATPGKRGAETVHSQPIRHSVMERLALSRLHRSPSRQSHLCLDGSSRHRVDGD